MFKRGVQPDYSNPGGFSNILAQEEPLLVTHEVKLIDPSDRKKTDIVWRYTDEGERIRVSVRTGRIIPMPILHLHTWEDGTNDMKKIMGENDTDVVKVKEETFQPKLCTFEEDICESMGIKYQPIKSRGYKY
ncbi:RM24-like protein [Mya arenaria]|uniref:RM24-like protein n=2 Tax=Mya arenaria TaxID=6604 RepID=A0ABY7DQV9_MYAAR|nr:RM24-like protein [Mya arenaria]